MATFQGKTTSSASKQTLPFYHIHRVSLPGLSQMQERNHGIDIGGVKMGALALNFFFYIPNSMIFYI